MIGLTQHPYLSPLGVPFPTPLLDKPSTGQHTGEQFTQGDGSIFTQPGDGHSGDENLAQGI